MENGVGPTTTTTTTSRPVRASRFFYNTNNTSSSSQANNNNFSGPVRKWEKKWVHVSQSKPKPKPKPNNNNNNKPSNGHASSTTPPILLCKWTPLAPSSDEPPRRKLRYTPVVVLEEQKKLASERASGYCEISGDARQSTKRLAMDAEDIYGMLDINQGLMEAHQEPN